MKIVDHPLLFIAIALLVFNAAQGFSQEPSASNRLIFLSDCQQPNWLETLRLKYFRNEEARDSLISDIIRQKPQAVFLLGDLVSAGSAEKRWKYLEPFLTKLHDENIQVKAIPGNHEYYWNAKRGIRNYLQRFPSGSLVGSCVRIDSMAVLLLNSNLERLSIGESRIRQDWYLSMMDTLDNDHGIKAIFVCTHHSPYTNSKIVRPSKQVLQEFVPRFTLSPKSKMFITGHSHNLEYFSGNSGKKFLVIGGGGGLSQPLVAAKRRLYPDLIRQEMKPIYFYLVIERKGDGFLLYTRGLQKDFGPVKTFTIGSID